MGSNGVLESLEGQAYRRTYTDGTIDLFLGVSLTWIGAAWIMLTDYAALAGVLPVAFVPVLITARKRLVENRLGYVTWAEARRNKERRNLIGMFAAGMGLLVIAMAGFLVVDRSDISTSTLAPIAPGLLAWLLAILSLALAYATESWRFASYAAVLSTTGLVTAMYEANPGWPILASGAVVAITGLSMLIRFLSAHPVPEE